MTPAEFKTSRQELLAGFPKREQRQVFALLLGYSPENGNRQISEKERGLRPISRADKTIIYLLRRIKNREGNLMEIFAWVVDQAETQA